jgi:hypothetical protein
VEEIWRVVPGGRVRAASAVTVGMKRMPDVVREILTLVFAMATLFTAFALAFPTSRG